MNAPHHDIAAHLRRRSFIRSLLVCVTALLFATAAFARAPFSSLVVFGDSLSDTGRLYELTQKAFPPKKAYWQGRMSNGPVWVEFLAHDYRLDCRVRNYAVTGAMTGPSATVPTGNVNSDVLPGLAGTSLSGQLASYLASTGNRIDPEALYIVEGGANDLLGPLAALLLSNPAPDVFQQQVALIAAPIVVNTATLVGTLRSLGAKYIAVVNIPDLGRTPRLLGFGPLASSTVSQVVALVNLAVSQQIDLIELGTGAKIARIDAYGFIGDVSLNPDDYGFTNAKDPFMILNKVTLVPSFAGKPRAAKDWFFWDDIHPTTLGHAFFADAAAEDLEKAYPRVRGCRQR